MKTSQPTLPVSAAPINWLEPVECSFGQLREVVAAAERAGFQPVRMACITGGYRVTFQRKPVIAVHPVQPFSKSPAGVTRPLK